jgi:CRISPR/Cas system CSM-associated protein Csm3 (group 7 of RAMP superfamily)
VLGVEVGTATYELQTGGNTLVIDTKKVEKGLYFIEVIRGNAKFTEKIVIKR